MLWYLNSSLLSLLPGLENLNSSDQDRTVLGGHRDNAGWREGKELTYKRTFWTQGSGNLSEILLSLLLRVILPVLLPTSLSIRGQVFCFVSWLDIPYIYLITGTITMKPYIEIQCLQLIKMELLWLTFKLGD